MAGELKLSLVIEAIDRMSAPIGRMMGAISGPARAIKETLGTATEQLARFGEHFAGFAATVGAGFELRDIIKEQDAFTRLGIDAGITAARTEELKQSIYDTAQKWGVGIDDLRGAFRGMFDQFKDGKLGIAQTSAALDVLAASMQRLGGFGPEVGKLFGVLERYGGLKSPKELLAGMAMLRAEIGPNSQWLADFASAAAQDFNQYSIRFNMKDRGLSALRDLGAVYSALRPASKTPRQSMTELEYLLDAIASDTNGIAVSLQSVGVNVLGRTPQEVAENVMLGHAAPLSQWFPEFARVVQEGKKFPGIELDKQLGPDLRDVISKMKLEDVVASLNAVGDASRYLAEAAEVGRTLESSLTRVGTAFHKSADTYARGPLQDIADTLAKYPGVVAGTATALASLAIFGTVAGWAINVIPALKFVGTALLSTAVFVTEFAQGLTLALGPMAAFDIAASANPIGAIVAVISAAAAASYELYEHWKDIEEIWAHLAPTWLGGKPAHGHYEKIGYRPVWRNDPAPPEPIAGRSGLEVVSGGYYTRIGYRRIFHPGAPPAPTIDTGQNQRQKVESNSRITIGFENAPPGLRVKKVQSGPGTEIRTELGYLLGTR